jgi:hypothetical protein
MKEYCWKGHSMNKFNIRGLEIKMDLRRRLGGPSYQRKFSGELR